MNPDGIGLVQPDDWKINMNDPWQVLWWSRYLGLTKSGLEAVIALCGPAIVDVQQFIATNPAALPAPDAAPVAEPVRNGSKSLGFMF